MTHECRSTGGDMGRGEYRYFNGPVENYEGCEPEEIREYVRQDYERAEGLNRGDWCYVGIRAVAEYQTEFGSPVQELRSMGLWGIESDSERSYFDEVGKEELTTLREELRKVGFSTRAISKAFKDMEEIDR